MSETALLPIAERQVEFYGDEITAVLLETGEAPAIYVPLRPLCEQLGLSWSGQRERVMRDAVLSDELRSVRITRTEAGERELLCLPLEFLPGWLFGISTARVKPELQAKILRYRRDCFRALWRAFQAEPAPVRQPTTPGNAETLGHIRDMGLAIARMAEQQMALEQRLQDVDARLDRAADIVRGLRQRMGDIESRLAPAEPVAPGQAAELAQRVRALGELLSSREPGANHYQAIFAELYRRFGVSSYKSIALRDFDEVMRFLEDWRRAATSG